MINTRRLFAVTALTALVLGASACSPNGAQPQSGTTSAPATPSASAASSGQPAQCGLDAQSGDMVQSGSVDRGNQAPEVDTADNEARAWV